MFDFLIPILASLATVSMLIGLQSLWNLSRAEVRSHLDPPPFAIQIIWPAVKLVEWAICPWIADRWLQGLYARLQRSSLDYRYTPSEFIALDVLCGFGIPILLLAVCAFADISLSNWTLITLMLLGILLPWLKLRELAQKRELLVKRDLPVFLDFLVMAVEAGLNLNGAMQQAVRHGPPGPLRDEWARLLRDIRTGLNRRDALLQMAMRLPISEIRLLVSALIQAESSGSSLSATLKAQASQRRVERFQRAEKLAMQAPVKLIFPLVAFIFPVTFLILAFPMIMKLKESF